jgi:Asp-tRNA(Asn)/Glu-tRNA(Gln) amidotransferase A subunit family amidase
MFLTRLFSFATTFACVTLLSPTSAAAMRMQLVGAFGEDLTVLQLARQFEEAHPWAARWPALATADA